MSKRESNLNNLRTNHDLKNVRNIPAIQGSSINTITGGHGSDPYNNSDLIKVSLSSGQGSIDERMHHSQMRIKGESKQREIKKSKKLLKA